MERTWLVSICILFLFPFPLVFAQESGLNWNKVLITVADSTGTGTSNFSRVIKNAIRLELVKTGFSAADLKDKNEEKPASSLFEDAESIQAGHLVLCTIIRKSSEEITLTFEWYTIGNMEKAAEITKRADINLSMDTEIANGAKELIAAAGITPEKRPVQKTELVKTPGDVKIVEKQPAAEGNRFNFSVGFAPFLATGAGTKYFTLGIEPHLNIGFRLRKPGHSLYFGFYSGLNRFVAEGVLLTAENYLIPLGLETRMIFDGGKHINFYLTAGAGPALFFLNSAAIGVQFKLIPFFNTGIGLDLMFTPAIGIALQLSYTFYLEGSIAIMGFLPSLRYIMRL